MSEPLSTDRTFFSAGTHIEGTLELDGEVKLEGQIKGKVTGTGVVTVGEHANLQADVFAPVVIVHGVVRGEMHATDRLELHRTAKVKGSIRAARVRIDEGAIFEGECRMAPKEAGTTKAEASNVAEEKRPPLNLTPPRPLTLPEAPATKPVS
jgi:cytoskeletal protein CcmA (bactofilin family)